MQQRNVLSFLKNILTLIEILHRNLTIKSGKMSPFYVHPYNQSPYLKPFSLVGIQRGIQWTHRTFGNNCPSSSCWELSLLRGFARTNQWNDIGTIGVFSLANHWRGPILAADYGRRGANWQKNLITFTRLNYWSTKESYNRTILQ